MARRRRSPELFQLRDDVTERIPVAECSDACRELVEIQVDF